MATRITQLAKLINENASFIEEHLQRKGESETSLGIDAPKRLPVDPTYKMKRQMAISAPREFADILASPAELLKWDWTDHSSERAIVNLGIAHLIPVGSEVSFSEIAEKTRLPERDIAGILRHVMCRHIFCEPREGYFAHTATSRLLAEDENEQALSWTVNNILWPAFLRTADAVGRFPGSEEAGESGFAVEFCTGKTMWEHFHEHPEWERKFGIMIGEAGANESLRQGVEWKGRVVDIGGGHGQATIDVLNHNIQVTSAVVQDWEAVAKAGKVRAPKDLFFSSRLKFEGHHNWSNKYSREIIKQLIPVMKPGRNFVVNEFMFPEWNKLPAPLERGIRDAPGWHQLFAEADSRLKIKSIKMTPPGFMAIIEVAWEPS